MNYYLPKIYLYISKSIHHSYLKNFTMKHIGILVFLFVSMISNSYSQNCDIQIEILPEQYMFGTAKEVKEEVKKIDVQFKENTMEVFLPIDGKGYLLSVLNENCKAYCKRQKRVRQLHSGDEKLVKNLIKGRESDIARQLKSCGG